MRRKRLSNNLSSQHVCICNSNSLNFRRLFLLIFFFCQLAFSSWVCDLRPQSLKLLWSFKRDSCAFRGPGWAGPPALSLCSVMSSSQSQHSTGMDTDLFSCSHHCWEFTFLEFRPVLPSCYWGTQEADISWYVIFLFFSCVYLSLGWRGSWNKLVTTGLR